MAYQGLGNLTDPLFGIEESAGAGTLDEASSQLYRILPDVTIVHVAIALLSAVTVFFGLFSSLIKDKLYVGEAILATVGGIAFSAYGGQVFVPRAWAEGHHFNAITLEFTRVVIALSVFAVGVELPRAYVKRHWKSLAMLLGPNMFIGWIISALLMWGLIPGLDFLGACVVAAGTTPTDPILAASVVGKGRFSQEHVPAHIRHLLQCESGCNDGAAFPFLNIALFLLLRDHYTVGEAVGYWFGLAILYQIVVGTLMGVAIGVGARKLMKLSKRRRWIDRESMIAMYVALALLASMCTTLAGLDDLLASFAAGAAFAWDDWFSTAIDESNFSAVIDLLINVVTFVYLGATMPFDAWNNPELTLTPWRLVVLAICILLLRRIPALYLMQKWIPDFKTPREALFCGHFGPMGVGAIFISTLAMTKLPTPTVPPETSLDRLSLIVQPVTYFLVLSSILVHGLSIGFHSVGKQVTTRVHTRVMSYRTMTQQTDDSGSVWKRLLRSSRPKRKGPISKADIVVHMGDGPKVDLEKGGDGIQSPAISEETPQDGPAIMVTGEEKVPADGEPTEPVVPEDVHITVPDAAHLRPSKSDIDLPASAVEVPVRGRPGAPARAQSHVRAWRDGHKVIVERTDDGEVQIIDLNPEDEALDEIRELPDNGRRQIVNVPRHLIERERTQSIAGDFESEQDLDDGAVQRAAAKLLKTDWVLWGTAGLIRGREKDEYEGLSERQKKLLRQEKLRRELDVRKEQHFHDGEEEDDEDKEVAREFIEGHRVVMENAAGEVIGVRKLTDAEREKEIARHNHALQQLSMFSHMSHESLRDTLHEYQERHRQRHEDRERRRDERRAARDASPMRAPSPLPGQSTSTPPRPNVLQRMLGRRDTSPAVIGVRAEPQTPTRPPQQEGEAEGDEVRQSITFREPKRPR